MFKFLRNLFKKVEHIHLKGMDIEIDKKKGTMTIISDTHLDEKQIRKLFEKYVLGED